MTIREQTEEVERQNLHPRAYLSLQNYKGRIRNFKVSMEEKIKELEQKRPVSVGFNLIAGGIVKIES